MSAEPGDDIDPEAAIRYSIVILTWMRDDALPATLGRLKAAMGERADAEVVLVDNNADDRDRGDFLQDFPFRQVVKIGRNKGVSSRNDGMDAARGEIVIVLDDDVLVQTEGFLDLFGEVFDAHPDVGVVNVRKLDAKTMSQLPECIPHSRKGVDATKPFFTFRFIGGLVAMRRSMHRELGGFSTEIFFGAEEREYSFRIIQAGWKIYYQPEIVAIETNDAGGRRSHQELMTETLSNMYIIAYLYRPMGAMIANFIVYTPFAWLKERGRLYPFQAFGRFLTWWRRPDRSRRRPLDRRALAYIRSCGGATWR
jgi:GT2 family glycosyltransferase